MTLRKKALKGVFWSGIEQFANQLIGFVISIFLARLLMPEEFGLIAMLAIFIGLGGALIDSGLTQSIIRTVDPDDQDYSTVFYFNLAGSIIIYTVVALCAPLIASFYEQNELTPILRVYALIFVINAFSAIQQTKLTKEMDFKSQMLASTPSLILGGATGIIMAIQGFGVWSLVWSYLVQSLTYTIQLWFWSDWRPIWFFSKEKFKHHFFFGFKLTLTGIIDTIYIHAYPIIIGKFFAPAQVGYYSKADGLKQLPVNVFSGIIGKITYPLFSEIQNDDIRMKQVYKKIMQMVIFLVAPTLIFAAVLAEPIFRFLYTEKWLPAVPYFQILCAAGILYPIHYYNLQILNVKGRSDLFLKVEIIKKIILTVTLIVSFQYGIYGLLYGSVFFSLIAFGINTHFSGKFINYTALQQTKDLLPTILLALLVGFIVYQLDYFYTELDWNDILRILFGGLTGLILYIGTSYIFRLNAMLELRRIILRLD
ncbi:MAG: lipopolysaccharide biosynthesis protein [Brumimicrobium sp.]|nr:lipopolysaccharide biosynthesis protein [Brumimicrobium sp.]